MALTNEEKLAREQQRSFSTIIPVITESVVQHSKRLKTPGRQDKRNSSDIANSTPESAQPVKRSRGRPRIIKEYNDPMKSPMASTSLKVQKQGLMEKGGKTVMKIGSLMTFDSPSKNTSISKSQSFGSISSYNTPKRMNSSKNDISPTLDKKVKRTAKSKTSPKKVVKSISTGNVSLKSNDIGTQTSTNKIPNSVSNGDIQGVLKYMSNNNVQKTPTRSRKNSVSTSIGKEINTNSSVSEIKKKQSRKNSLLYNSQLDTPFTEIRNTATGNNNGGKSSFIDTPSSITSTTRKQLSKLSLKLDRNGRAYIEKIEEDNNKTYNQNQVGENRSEEKFVATASSADTVNEQKQQFVAMYETQNSYKTKHSKENVKSVSKGRKEPANEAYASYTERNKDIDMLSSNDDHEAENHNHSGDADYLNWNNPLLKEKSLNADEKKKVVSMLKKFNSHSNLLTESQGINIESESLEDENVLLDDDITTELDNNRMKTPPLSQSVQFTNTESNHINPVNANNSAVKLNTDEMEIAIPALLELSPMNMSILNRTPNGKFNFNSINSLGNVNMTNPHLNSATKFLPMGSPFSSKHKHLGMEDYDYQKFFSMSPNNKEHVTLNKTPNINTKDSNQQSLGMMFNIDSVLQSPNNNIFQAFSQAVYSSPLSNNNNNNNESRLQHPINLDIKSGDSSKNDQFINDDFFKSFNPIKMNSNSITRSPRIIIENNKKKDNKDKNKDEESCEK